MKRILIADDHPAIRNGVKRILADEFLDVQFGEAVNGAETLKLARSGCWDVLILDVDMPGRNGLEVLKQLKDEKIPIPVLMFSMYPEDQLAVRAIRSGAMGYLSKSALDEELVQAVKKVLTGKRYITPLAAELLATQLENPQDRPLHELLSDREYQTFLLLAKGKPTSEIAEELSLSIPTISTYRARILEKMNMKSNAELVRYAIEKKLI